MTKAILLLSLALAVAACSGAAPDSAAEKTGGNAADAGQDESVFDPMVGTMDRAAGVEELGIDRKAQTDAAVEGSE